MNFVSTSIYRKALHLALSEGLMPASIAHHPPLSGHGKAIQHIPITLLWEVYELANRSLAAGFGIRQGLQLEVDDYGTLGLSWKTCWKARDILERTERYMILITDYGSIKVIDQDEITQLYLHRDPIHPAMAVSNEATFVMITKVIREVTAVDIYPERVTFKHEAPKDISSYCDYFQCPVAFQEQHNALYFKSADLESPTVKADKSIQQFFVERMEEEAEGIKINANKLVKDVQELIKEALPSGIPSVIQVGAHLGMSSRTLKRRLTEHGFSFRDLVKNTQEDLSLDLLKNSSHSIGEIAFQAGYSEQSAFNRAFKRWTGQSPVEYRKAL